jgi:hypothetical protein
VRAEVRGSFQTVTGYAEGFTLYALGMSISYPLFMSFLCAFYEFFMRFLCAFYALFMFVFVTKSVKIGQKF